MYDLASWFAYTCITPLWRNAADQRKPPTRQSIEAYVPAGYQIVPGTVHDLGTQLGNADAPSVTISVTGDSEKDEAGHHPWLELRFNADDNLSSCSLRWRSEPPAPESDVVAREKVWRSERAAAVPYLAFTLSGLLAAAPSIVDPSQEPGRVLLDQPMLPNGPQGWTRGTVFYSIGAGGTQLWIDMPPAR